MIDQVDIKNDIKDMVNNINKLQDKYSIPYPKDRE